jgi:hypothetical protein
MSNKKKTAAIPSTNSQTLKIGSRVRCTDDGVEGRIVWANAVSVKIRWDDSEQITWRRDSLADRPIEILAEGGDEEQTASPAAPNDLAQINHTELPQAELEEAPEASPRDRSVTEQSFEHAILQPALIEQRSEPPAEPTEGSGAAAPEMTPTADAPIEEGIQAETVSQTPTTPEPALEQSETGMAEKQSRMRRPKTGDDGKAKRLSALDAAAKVLAETKKAMTCPELIDEMAVKGYWISPAGKTPQSTLYSAIARDITAKGAQSRFVKAERGKFARNGAV